MANALSADGVTIWFAPAGTLGAGLAATGKKVQTFINNYDKSGGETDVESVPLFGNANIDRKKPTSQIELSFDVIFQHGTDVDYFDRVADGSEDIGMIVIENKIGTSYYWKAFNNVSVVVLDEEFSAEEEWKGTLSFKLSPTDVNGLKNVLYGRASSVETELDATKATGSSWE